MEQAVDKGAGGMRGAEGTGPAVDFPAIGSGVLWGLLLMLVSAVLLGIYDYRAAPSPEVETGRTLVLQVVAAALSGFRAARLAGRSGVLHGLLAGLGVIAAAVVITGILTDLTSLGGLLRAFVAGGGAGALAGVVAVNLGR